ncbi:MAG: iron-containing alcohol dehydrogenase [Desulfarculus sp.]|jgi:alcohol dehydrogenase class IV|nr:MAG: iron-containing alcohol dehydrogenase [Desulfarculus sp.]
MFKTMHLRTPEWIHFGFGAARQTGAEAKRLGAGRVLVLSGPNVAQSGLLEPIFASLRAEGLENDHFAQVEEEPSIANFYAALKAAKEGDFDVFVGVGGGSAMDLTKMVAALMVNPGRLEDYFGIDMVPRRGRPSILIATTSGTGAESTRIAVFSDLEAQTKRVISAQNILADVAIVDPELTLTMPPKVTADTGMDAFIHALESYLAKNANPVTDNLALMAIELAAANLGPAFADGGNREARYNMSLASMLAGVALNNAGVGVMHALSFPIGREYHLTHGPALIVIMAATMRSLAVACPDKFREVAEAFGVDTWGLAPWEASEEAVQAMVRLAQSVGLPTSLSEVQADRSRIQAWAEAAYANRRLLDNTPRSLSAADIASILEDSF